MSVVDQVIYWNKLSKNEQKFVLLRSIKKNKNSVRNVVRNILVDVKKKGDAALRKYTFLFDKKKVDNFLLKKKQIDEKLSLVSQEFKDAVNVAFKNIYNFHAKQNKSELIVKIQRGIKCWQISRPIKSIGIYIPGGFASLVSTVLMLAIPAKIAKCKNICLCSPPNISSEILYVAKLCGIKKIFQVGGAHAICALAYGTSSIPKVDKIFGPGNAYVTEAKIQIQRKNRTAIDMPAGPSEIFIIADKTSNVRFIVLDLLAQAEHGIDSQSILVTTSKKLAFLVKEKLKIEYSNFSKSDILQESLKNIRIIIANSLMQCVEISNFYAPEHLSIQINNPKKILPYILAAGSIFLGRYSAVAAGDYVTGSNHVLPTNGYASIFSGLGIVDFQKKITVQELTKEGLMSCSKAVNVLSRFEKMYFHGKSVTERVNII